MLIHFDKPECLKHRKSFEYTCMVPECLCQIRLCVSCTHEHCKKYGKSDFMKEINFYKKVEMETDIIEKQYSFLETHFTKQNCSDLLSSKNDESIKLAEFIMRVVNEDKKAVFKAIDEFGYNHMGVKKKLAKIQASSNRKYLSLIQSPDTISMMINLSSIEGLQRLRKKVMNCQSAARRYNEFLVATQKYGDNNASFLFGLGFKNPLLKEGIKKLISFEKEEIKVITNESQKRERSEKKASNDKNSNTANKCEQLFAPLPNSAKKIKLLTPQKRPKTSSSADKEN